MINNSEIKSLKEEFCRLLSLHPSVESPSMDNWVNNYIELFNHRNGLYNCSITLFNLKTGGFLFHNSNHNNRLKHPVVCPLLKHPLEYLMALTEPKNLKFCLETMIESYRYLMSLTAEEQEIFNVAYISYLLENDRIYHPYLIRLFVRKFDEQGNPLFIEIDTQRLIDLHIPEFRYFRPVSATYTEEHPYSLHLLKLNLNEADEALLTQYRDDIKRKMIGEKLNKSTHTIVNYYSRVEKLYDLHSIQTVSEIAGIMDMLRREYPDYRSLDQKVTTKKGG